ncbi:Myosin 10A, isoform D, partial [Cladochytrium tenue]
MTANAEAQERLMREALDRVTGALQRLERRVTAMEVTLRDAVSDGLAPRGDVGGGRQLPAADMPKLKVSGSAGSIVVDTTGDWADGPAGWGGSDDMVFELPVNGRRRSASKSRRKSVQEQAAFLAAAGQGSGSASTGEGGGADFGTAAVSSPSLFPGDEGKAVSPRSQFPRLPEAVACSGLPKKELMRFSVIYEFLDTERDYVNDLRVMLIKELDRSGLLTESDLKVLFSNIEQLVEANSSLVVYTEYCGNYPGALKLLRQLQLRQDIKDILQRLMSSPEGRGLTLESYPLLLRELLKNTEKDHKDHSFVEKAAEKIEAIVIKVNEATQALDRIMAIQSKIDSATPLNLEDKKLIKDGLASRFSVTKSKEKYIVLLSDVFLVCRAGQKGRYTLETTARVADLSFRPDPRGDSITRGPKHAITLSLGPDTREVVTLCFANNEERTRWHEALVGAIKAEGGQGADPRSRRSAASGSISGLSPRKT